jgi:AcrR family transcriptional regulator
VTSSDGHRAERSRRFDVVSEAALPTGDPTRDRLLTAAAEVFAEKGYDRAGVQEIARRAGFTTGAIYGRFRGKAQLLLAAMEVNSHDELEELFAEHRFEGRATDILTTVGSHLVTDEFDSGQALLLEAFVAGRRDPEVAGMLRRIIEERTVSLTALVDEAKSTGAIDPALDTRSIVRFCHAVALGFLLFGAIDLDRPDSVPWETLIARLVDAVAVDAVGGPEPAD